MGDKRDQRFDLAAILKFVDIATSALGEAREEIDALNVYPVPDGDTGTNMFLTVSAAREALMEATGGDPTADLAVAMATFSRGALLGARGNSGVILSQMLGAVASRIADPDPAARHAQIFGQALHEATVASYAAVGTPVEGTMLTVSRAAADAAIEAAAQSGNRTTAVLGAAAQAAREALEKTPTQLKALADAGVVDAGGRGLCVILDAAETALTGRRPIDRPRTSRQIPVPMPTNDLQPGGPSYEVMYLLDADDEGISGLKETLAGLGDSLVVVGGEGLWNVHVHVDDVGAAIEAGIVAGRPHRVRVTHFAEQVEEAQQNASSRTGRRIVAVAAGAGLRELFEEAGAVVVTGGPGQRPSTGMLLEAIEDCAAAEVVVLPNDSDSVRVAEIAARTAEESGDVRVAVIPTQAQVQGLAAIAVHEPGRSFDQDLLHMTATARHARHGGVTVAAKQAITMAGPCEPGDVLGVIEGDFALVGQDLFEVAAGIIDKLIGGGGELITLVAGVDGTDLAARCEQYVESAYPIVDVVVYDGGQERYPLLLAVE
ncbi:DAK2 domain-containing protein [Nocardioides sp. JQ2195]|uniref:DAK2 domain-containing protein n=1 Tax=Nocardioides sp. JQ2195 TaxID=2592334 RepID=UPI00143EEEF7|nr:DAK2 domain-containing protein [Nocardioides sp. JQ2195]QIX26187.1 DAK2 domain-containing protein [Nocardioides sp. JQ2195]